MFYSRTTTAQLQPIVEQFWYCNHSIEIPQKTLTLPYGRIELVVNLKGNYTIQKENRVFEGSRGWISGQQKGASISTISGQHECIGIVFTPLGWKLLSEMDACEIKDGFIPVSGIIKQFDYVFEQLSETDTPLQKLLIVESYLQKLKSKKEVANNTIRNALFYISKNEGKKISINELSGQLNLSRKSLNNHFQNYIGLPASAYLQQRFFSHLLRGLCTNTHKRLIEHTYEHHFFDQAHFIKQFQIYSGMTPGDYIGHVKAGRVDCHFPNFISL